VGDSSAYLFDGNNAEKLTPEHRCDNQEEIARVKYFVCYRDRMEVRSCWVDWAGFWLLQELLAILA